MSDMNFIVVGDSMLDRYYEGPVSRISPEAPCPVVDVHNFVEMPGGAANVVMNLASLGHTVDLVTVFGGQDDDEGTKFFSSFFENMSDVRLHAYHFTGFRTPIKTRVCSHNGMQLLRFDQQDSKPFWDKTVNAAILAKVEELLVKAHESGNPSVLILSDYAKGVLGDDELVSHLLGMARDMYIPSIVDPKSYDFHRYEGATLIKPNLAEAQAALGDLHQTPQPGNVCARDLLQAWHPSFDMVVVTAGGDGMHAAMHNGKSIYVESVPAYPSHWFYNSVGAGDTVTALLAESLCCLPDDYNAAHHLRRSEFIRASIGAGVVTGRPFTAVLTEYELLAAMADAGVGAPGKIVDVDGAMITIEEARSRGEEIVFANGCFDLLHPGHIHLLTEARAIGGLLIVAINSDDSVTKCKGTGRPLIPLEQRAVMLEALECVDIVIPFNEDTPEELIRKIKPDWLVKGEEYYNPEGSINDIPGAVFVLNNGRGVKFVKMLEGYSTTKLANKELPPPATVVE